MFLFEERASERARAKKFGRGSSLLFQLPTFFFPFPLSPSFFPLLLSLSFSLSLSPDFRIMPCLTAAARAPAMAAQQQPSLCARGSSGAAASSSSLRASTISPISPPRRFHQRRSSASLSVVAASTADRTFFVGGNWKSNCTKSSVKTLVKELNDAAKGQLGGLPQADQVEIVVGPEHIHLSMVLDAIDSRYGVSAQNCWTTSGGAYTGEVRA